MSDRISLEEYQVIVENTWTPESTPAQEELRIVYGIFGELGEIAELNKKYMRDGGDPKEWRKHIKKEFGDVFYYLAKYANFFDLDLEEILIDNTLKLADRKERGVIKGSGNER